MFWNKKFKHQFCGIPIIQMREGDLSNSNTKIRVSDAMKRVLVDRQAGILLQQADFFRVLLLDFFEGPTHVVTSSSIVQVSRFVDVLDVPAGHFQHRKDKRLIACSQKELTVLISQVLLLDLEEQFSAEGPEMAELLNDLAVILFLNGELGVSLRISFGDILFILSVVNVIGIRETWIFSLVDCVEKLEDMAANELIVSIYFKRDGVILTVVMNCVVQISQRPFSFLPLDHNCPFLWDRHSPEISLDKHSSLVIRVIINNNHQVIAIFLIEDRLQVVHIPMLLHIIPSRNHNAHRDLIIVFIDIVLTLI